MGEVPQTELVATHTLELIAKNEALIAAVQVVRCRELAEHPMVQAFADALQNSYDVAMKCRGIEESVVECDR